MRATVWSCLLVFSIAGSAQTPDRPDFSGRWILVKAEGVDSRTAREMTVRQGSPVSTTAGGTQMTPFIRTFSVERRFDTGATETDHYQIGISGGVVPGLPERGVTRPAAENELTWTHISAAWKGGALVIWTARYSGPTRESGPFTEHEEDWRLDSAGNLVIAVTDRISSSETRTGSLVYRRQDGAGR